MSDAKKGQTVPKTLAIWNGFWMLSMQAFGLIRCQTTFSDGTVAFDDRKWILWS